MCRWLREVFDQKEPQTEPPIVMNPAALKALLEGDVENVVIALTPGGIEAQEARGQQSFVAGETLPRKLGGSETREMYEALGIVFGNDADDIFVHVRLPKGWHKEPTDHSMWSDLLDDKGRVRAHIFYKAAFYDRDAFMSLQRRYYADARPINGWVDDYQDSLFVGVVTDQEIVIWKTEDTVTYKDYNKRDLLLTQAIAWLTDHYPDYKNPLAYWDD